MECKGTAKRKQREGKGNATVKQRDSKGKAKGWECLVWIRRSDSVWIRFGFGLDSVWIRCGFGLDSVLIVPASFKLECIRFAFDSDSVGFSLLAIRFGFGLFGFDSACSV